MNDDLISRSALRKAVNDFYDNSFKGMVSSDLIKYAEAVDELIDNAPTVDTTFREVVAYECGQKSAEERPQGNKKNGKGCWNCQHCKRVNKELVGEEWRCDLTDWCFGYHTLIDHWCRHWAKLKR